MIPTKLTAPQEKLLREYAEHEDAAVLGEKQGLFQRFKVFPPPRSPSPFRMSMLATFSFRVVSPRSFRSFRFRQREFGSSQCRCVRIF